ncbi:MAG TPA: DUF5010 domain-containing protein [Polyangiaceae bacterium]|nr:DUF5010 domain-containing protein [Polyangiaceae bacterium]
MKLLSASGLLLLVACSRGSYQHEDAPSGSGGGASTPDLPENAEFALGAEFDGPCERSDAIDVNLGNAPESFVRAAYCQVNGVEPDAAVVSDWSQKLRTVAYVRRVDVVRSLCEAAARTCTLSYSDPWQEQVSLTASCQRTGTRDVGAVLMFWSDCPNGANCTMDWANTHTSGMNARHALFGFGDVAAGFYNPDNPGFWRRELLDARWAGMQFLLPNTYGPDMAELPVLVDALDDIGGGIQIGMFDDTWGWGRGDSPPWNQQPNMADVENSAQLIYQNKWKAFFQAIPEQYWYRVQERPFIYFYNAGTLKPQDQSSGVIARMKQLFAADFGVEPFVAVDHAFFADDNTVNVADSEFTWNTFSGNAMSLTNHHGVSHAHFMAKWDSLGRDSKGTIADGGDRIIKGPELLQQYLDASSTANVAVVATWNDLGEGTGINRNYDYYHQGQWLAPNHFLRVIRDAQCSN